MTFMKAIEHNKVRRRDTWRWFLHADGCGWCKRNLLNNIIKERRRQDMELKEFAEDEESVFIRYKKESKDICWR